MVDSVRKVMGLQRMAMLSSLILKKMHIISIIITIISYLFTVQTANLHWESLMPIA